MCSRLPITLFRLVPLVTFCLWAGLPLQAIIVQGRHQSREEKQFIESFAVGEQ